MKLIFFSVFYFVAVIIIAHFFVPPEYNWLQHTVSDLAAQGLQYQWIMQLGFIGFGLLLNISFILKFVAAKKVFYPDVLIMLYGLAVLLSGFFSAATFLEGVSYAIQEDKLHSLFAQAAGVFFSVGILSYLIVSPDPKEKLIHTIFLTLVMGTSMVFGLEENGVIHLGKGLIQRTLYLVSFIWLLVSQYWSFRTLLVWR
ncbi:MAG: DUF998 domain-containing protein [Anaerolineales bacterium]|nr:DUF998 domain-containing protein [Anaerolineales bacterium]